MSRDYWDEMVITQIPSGIFVAAKNGAVDESRSETLLVWHPKILIYFLFVLKIIKIKAGRRIMKLGCLQKDYQNYCGITMEIKLIC